MKMHVERQIVPNVSSKTMKLGTYFYIMYLFTFLLINRMIFSSHFVFLLFNVFYRAIVAWSLIFQLVLLVKWFSNHVAQNEHTAELYSSNSFFFALCVSIMEWDQHIAGTTYTYREKKILKFRLNELRGFRK